MIELLTFKKKIFNLFKRLSTILQTIQIGGLSMKHFFSLFFFFVFVSGLALAQVGDSEETLLEQAKALAKEQSEVNQAQPISFSVEAVTHPLFVGVDDVTVPAYVGDPLTVDWDSVFVGVEVWGAAYDINNNKIYVNDGTGLYEWVVGSGTVTFLGTFTDTSGATISMVSLAFYNGALYGTRNVGNEAVYEINLSTFVATVFIDYEELDFDFGGLAVDPNTGEFYGTSDDTAPLGSGLYRINMDGTGTLITPYPAGQTDIDGLAVSDDQIAYLVTDQQDSIYIYDLVGGTYLPAIANPWTSSEVFCGGTWIYEIGGGCNLFEDTFDSNIAQWTEVGGLGAANWFWGAGNQAGGAAPGELTFAWTPAFTGDSYLMSPVMPSAGNENTISFQHYINWYGGPGTVGVAYTTDSGTSWTPIWSVVDPPGSIGPEPVVVNAPGDANFQLGFYWSGNSFNINFWHIDDVCVNSVVPVELTSFAASVNNRNVNLNWTTATETNNQGFEIERNSGNGFENVGYVPGFGTTTEQHSYSYTDANLSSGTYSYRLKQIDFDGTFDYSETVEVEIVIPDVYSLSQNYPNPFNPSTKITFSLAADSKVSLKVFDVLGQEVASLVNQDLAQGVHTYDFNAAGINSGVYFYQIEATGVKGTKFIDVKKMILVK